MKIVLPNVSTEAEVAKEMFMIQFREEKIRTQYGICKMVSARQTQGFCGPQETHAMGLRMNHYPFLYIVFCFGFIMHCTFNFSGTYFHILEYNKLQ